MNALEVSLCKSVVKAFDAYETATDEWLTHAPEHYLQNAIFVHLSKKDNVFLEATRKKIIKKEGRSRLGRPPKSLQMRYDLVVWGSNNSMKAVIEVKRCLSLTQALRRDARRIQNETRSDVGYLIVYSEIKAKRGYEGIRARFKEWESTLGLEWLNTEQDKLAEWDDWIAGFALFRTCR